jgi:hypothetical protein
VSAAGPKGSFAAAADRAAKRGFAAPGEPGHPLTPAPDSQPAAAAPEARTAQPIEPIEPAQMRELRLRCLEAVAAVRFMTPSAGALVAAAAELERYVIQGAPDSGVTQN